MLISLNKTAYDQIDFVEGVLVHESNKDYIIKLNPMKVYLLVFHELKDIQHLHSTVYTRWN